MQTVQPKPDPFDLNGWLNLGRRANRTMLDAMREADINRIFNIEQSVVFNNRTVVCADGYTVSIQASFICYCLPKRSLEDVSGYETFELGYPSMLDSLLEPYNRGVIYVHVPRSVVEELIAIHGGIVSQIELPDEMPLLTPGEPLNGDE